MIKYEYQLKTNLGNKEEVFLPEFPKELPDLVYFEGPNSSGKSTLLHLLALSFGGHEDEKIRNSLKDKLENLLSGEQHKLSFSFDIVNRHGEVELIAKKKVGGNVELRDGSGGIVNPSKFKKKYNLIYDIPEEPTKRLPELTREIQHLQSLFSNKLETFSSYLRSLIQEIKEAKDPDKIGLKEGQLRQRKEDALKFKTTFDHLMMVDKNVKTHTYIRFYIANKKAFDDTKAALSQVDKVDRVERKKDSQVRQSIIDMEKLLNTMLAEVLSIYEKTRPILDGILNKRKFSKSLSDWDDIDWKHEFRCPTSVPEILIDDFLNEIKRQIKVEEEGPIYLERKLCKELKSLLINYSTQNVHIPGIENSIKDYIDLLNNKIEGADLKDKEVESLKSLFKSLADIKSKFEHVAARVLPQLGAYNREYKNKNFDCSSSVDDFQRQGLEDKLRQAKEKLNQYRFSCEKLGLPEEAIVANYSVAMSIKPYCQFDEQTLLDEIEQNQKKLDQVKDDLRKADSSVEYLEDELNRLRNKQEHRYHAHLPLLLRIDNIINSRMRSKIVQNGRWLAEIIDNSKKFVPPTARETERKEYFEKLFCYLGRRIGKIRHIRDEYVVEKVDLIKKQIIAKGGAVIQLADMGTGQGQSAYLTGLLSADDGRKIIALFDEVAMMDEVSLGDVKRRMVDLYSSDLLLLGVIVQKGSERRVVPFL